jgi:hypothetical protein
VNLRLAHYVLIICSALAIGLPSLEPALPLAAGPILKACTAVLILIAGVLGAISPSAGLPRLPLVPALVPPPPAPLVVAVNTVAEIAPEHPSG